MAKFSEVIECLKNGGMASRQAWTGNYEVMMQIPQRISKDIVPKMTSVQDIAKPKIGTVGSGEIEYHDQVLIIMFTDDETTPAKATYFIPTWEDIFAEDWTLTQPAGSYKDRMKAEYKELSERMEKLYAFLGSPVYQALPMEKQLLQKHQYAAMAEYLYVLGERCKLEDINL